MNVKHGDGKTVYGPGVSITLTGDEVAEAIDAYLVAHGVCVRGPRSVLIDGRCGQAAEVYVDPEGFVIDRHGYKWAGGYDG